MYCTLLVLRVTKSEFRSAPAKTMLKRLLNNGLHLPGEDTEDEVHDEEGAEDDHGHEIAELPSVALSVMDLNRNQDQKDL